MSHGPRCERSKTDPRRCRCECDGRGHGVQAVRERLHLEAVNRRREAEETELPHD